MNAFSTFRTIMLMLPFLIEGIKALEEAIPGQGQGEQKLAAIRSMIEILYEPAKEIMPLIEKVIGVLVNTFNATGVFRQ
jgi:hypothetical protein